MADMTPTAGSGEQDVLSLNAGDGDSLTLPEGFDLTSSEFQASGDDLIVTAPDGSQVVVEDYYAQENPPQLTTPGGAELSGEMIVQLAEGPAGSDVSAGTDGATAGGGDTMIAANPDVITGTDGEPIGNVENLSGQVFAIRADGTKVELNVGDPVYQGDILESGADGSIGVLLADETTFSMGEEGRMVLDEMIYDPSTQEGSVSMTALQGVFTFVSGQVAKTDPDAMTLDTPVATIGIRGTQVGLDISDGQNLDVVLMEEADGFVGEVVVMNDAGVQVLNGANQMTGITGFQAAPSLVSVMAQDSMIEQYDQPLRHLPIVHGNQNDFGLQRQDEGEFLDQEIENLEEAAAEDLANFETAAGQEEEETGQADIIPVTGELEQLKVLDPFTNIQTVTTEQDTSEEDDTVEEVNDEVLLDDTIVIPDGKQAITGANGETIFIPDAISNASYNSESGKIEGTVEGDLVVDENDPYSYDLTASDDDNVVVTGAGGDIIRGSAGDDQLSGGSGNDTLDGGEGNDTLDGGAGDDMLIGGLGDDVVDGGVGDDFIVAGPGLGNDTYIGGDGIDTISYEAAEEGFGLVIDLALGQAYDSPDSVAPWINLDTLIGIENVIGGAGGDLIRGSADNNVIDGGAGDDIIDGGAGDDTLSGGEGDDLVIGGYGNDVLYGGGGNNVLVGGHGDDLARFDGALSDFGVTTDGNDFLVVNNVTGETTALRGIEQMIFTADGIEQSFAIVELDASEDQPFALNLFDVVTVPEDADPADVTVSISGFPEGTTLEVNGEEISANSDGAFELGSNQLGNVVVHAPDGYGDDMALDVQMTVGDTLVGSAYMSVDMEAIADMPHIEAFDVAGGEDIPIGLNMDATLMDLDGSETISITLSGVPFGGFFIGETGDLEEGQGVATLTSSYTYTDEDGVIQTQELSFPQDTVNGTFTIDSGEHNLTPQQMSEVMENLIMTPALHHDEDFTVTVEATVTDSNGDTETFFTTTGGGDPVDSLTFDVEVYDRADAPTLDITDAVGLEDTRIELNIDAASIDQSEVLSMSIGGIPEGATLYVQYEIGGNVVEVPMSVTEYDENGLGVVQIPSALIGSTFLIEPQADSNVDFDLTITATSYEPDASEVDADGNKIYEFATSVEDLHVQVDSVADEIPLTAEAASGDEDTAIPLEIYTELQDTDGSESISITIDGVPDGALLNAGTDNGDGSWTLTTDDLDGLTITPAPNSDADFTLDVTATVTDVGEPGDVDVWQTDTPLQLQVTVDPKADEPVLVTEPAVGYEDTPIALDIQAGLTDTDGSEVLSITISDVPDGAVLSAGTQLDDGSWLLTPEDLDGLTITPPHDSNVDFDLTITATATETGAPGEIAELTSTLSVDVIGVADEISLDAAGEDGNAGFEIPLDIATGITDTDGSETVSVSIEGFPEGTVFSAGTDNGDRSWSFTTGDLEGLTITPPVGYDGELSLDVTATTTEDDGDSNSTSGTITFEVDGESEPPTLDLSDTSGLEDTAIDLDVNAALTDTDGSEVLSITVSGVPEGASLSAGEDLGDGSWLLTPDQLDGLQVTPPADSNVDFTLTVTATASTIAGPGSEEIVDTADTVGEIFVDVVGVADTPDLETSDTTGDEDTEIPLNIDASLLDVDGSETLSITITGVPDGATLNTGIHDTETGTWTLTPDQLEGLTITPPLGSTDDFDLSVTATTTEDDAGTLVDAQGNDIGVDSVTMPLHVNVLDVADQPTLVLTDNVGYEDNAIPVPVHAALTDDSEVLTVTISGVPDGAVLSAGTDNGDGSWSIDPNQLEGLTVTPPDDSNEDFTLTVTATSTSEDGDIATTTGTIDIDVIGVADTPDLETQDAMGDEGVPIPLDISAGLNDLDGSETLTIEISNVPDGAVMAVDGIELSPNSDGVYTLTSDQLDGVTVTAPPDTDGDFTLHVVARAEENDGDIAISSGVINVNIELDLAAPPTLVLDNAQGVEDNVIPLDIAAAVTDPDDVLESITISGIPEGASLSAGTINPDGSVTLTPDQLDGLTITPPADSNVNFDVTVTATTVDGESTAQTTGTLSVNVLGDADTPELETSDASGTEGEAIALDISAAVTDTDGSESLSITISGVPEGAVLNAGSDNGDGSWTLEAGDLDGLAITPADGYDDDFTLTVTATATDVEPDGETPHTDTATVVGTIDVDMADNAEPPVLIVGDVTGNEDTPIPLDIDAAITDVGDVLSITITDIPQGAVLSAGTVNDDGSVTLTPDQLDGLTITPPTDSNVDFDLTVTATSTDGDDTETTTGTLSVDVVGVADAPTLTTEDVSGTEDTPIALDIASGLTDTDGSETLSITISGLPEGASLNAGTVNPDGSVTLTAAQLDGLTLTPPADSDEDFALIVTATTTENDGDTAQTLGTINVDLSPDADMPTLELTPAAGLEDNAIALDISAALTDTDGSESLSITISDIPEGVVLSAGTVNPDGSVTLTSAQLDGLTATPPLNSDEDFALTVTATSTDGDDTAVNTGTLNVSVAAVADTPTLDAGDGDGNLGQTIDLDISSALTDTDGSESLSITISDVPEGAVINGGEQTDDGTWVLTEADLADLTITLPAGASDDFDLTVTSTSTEADGGDQAATTVTSSINVDPNAVDDTDTVDSGQVAGGNVLDNDTGSIEGANSVTDVTFGDVTKSFDNPDDVMSDDNGDYLLIDGEHGSLKMYGDGTYEYTADDNGAGASGSAGLEGTGTSAEVEAAWDGIETFAFDFGTSMINGDGKFDPSLADDTVTFTSNGIGVAGTEDGMPVPDQINHNEETGESEALGINLGTEATSAEVKLSNLYVNEDGGEQGRWQAFDADGNLVGEGVIDASTVDYDGSNNVGTVDIDTGGAAFQYVVFTATDTGNDTNPNDSSDFYVRAIDFQGGGVNEGEDLFTYTMSDADGDTAVANLTLTVENGDVTAETPELVVDDALGYEDTGIALDISAALTDTDGSETLSITISDIPDGAVLSAGTVNDDGSVTLTPDQLDGLSITPPHDSNVDFNLTVSATSVESSTGDTATTSSVLPVDVVGVADAPPLEVELGEGTVVSGDDMPDFPPFDHAISNIVLYVADENGDITKVKIDDFSGAQDAVHDVNDLDLAGFVAENYPGSDLLAMTVKAGNNHPDGFGPGEGELLIVASGTTEGDLPVADHADVTYDYSDLAGDLAGGSGGVTGTEYPLDITTSLVDADGSETLSINVAGLPDGVTLSAGSQNDDGSWTVAPEDLSGLTVFVPADEDIGFDIDVTSTTTENDGDTASVSASVSVEPGDVTAETPDLDVTAAQGFEDTGIALDISAALTDTDGSETLSVTVSDIPEGAVLSAGTLNDDGSVTLTPDQLDGLSITPPADSNDDFNLTVSATSVESASGDTSTTSASLAVDVVGVADEPPLEVALGEGVYVPGEAATGSFTVENAGDISAGYHNSYGYYTMDEAGNPVAGEVIWADIKDTVGESFTLDGVDPSTVGFFLIPNGDNVNPDLQDGLDVTFEQNDNGQWVPVGPNGEALSGQGAPALFSEPGLNANGYDYMIDNQVVGNQNWEDLVNGGDEDFNDANFTATFEQGGPATPGTTEFPLDIATNLVDTDGSETLSITVSDLPEGAVLSAGTVNDDGSVTLTTAELEGLTLSVPEGTDAFDLTVTSTTTEDDGDSASVSATVGVQGDVTAEAPDLEVSAAQGDEDTAIALDISAALTDTDGSETLSITISDIPDGAVLSAGTVNDDGSVTLTPDQLDGLTITPPTDSNVDFNLTVSATSVESASGDTSTTSASLAVDVVGVADEPGATAADASGLEDRWIQLDLDSQMSQDTDGSETLSITIAGVPEGARLNPGTDLGGGVWTATADELPSVCILPPDDFSGDIPLVLSVTTTEDDGDTNTVTQDFSVSVEAVADTPNVELSNVQGVEDNVVPLDISAALTDTDGSESLSITISDIPEGVMLSAGTLNDDGSVSLTSDELEGLSLTAPEHSNVDFALTVTATSTDGDDTAVTTGTVQVDMVGVADVPPLEISLGEGVPVGGDAEDVTINMENVTDTSAGFTVTGRSVDENGELSDPSSGSISFNNSYPQGFGVSGASSGDETEIGYDSDSGTSEELIVAFDDDVTSVDVSFAWKHGGEDAVYELYRDGVKVGEGTVIGGSDGIDPAITLAAEDGSAFDQIVFSAPGGGDDYLINSIEFTTAGEASGMEYPLDIATNLVDADGSETLSITVSDLPQGAVLSAGTDNGDGSYTLTTADLEGLSLNVPQGTEAFDLTVTSTTTENDGDTASVTATLSVEGDVTAEAPDLAADDAAGLEDDAIALDIAAALTDTDGSETLSVTISDIPQGAELSAGTLNDDGSVTLTADQLDGLTITPPDDSNVDFALTITATSTESATGDTATTTTSLDVAVTGVADTPVVEAALGAPTLIEVPGETPEPTTVFSSTFGNQGGFVDQVDGWTTSSESIEVWTNGEQQMSGDGSYVELNDDAVDNYDDATNIMREFPTEEGATYTLTFEYSPRPGYDADVNAFEFRVDGETLGSLAPDGTGNSDNVWQSHTVTFVGTGEPMNLEFLTTGEAQANGRGIRLDNIEMTETLPAEEGENVVEYPLDITSSLTDTDGSEVLSVTVGNLPDGAVLSVGTLNDDGSVTLTAAQLNGLTVTVPQDTPAFDLAISATATENDGDTASISTSVAVAAYDAVADAPDLTASDVSGDEDTAIALDIAAALTDTDGSETLSVTISEIPEGAELSAGTLNDDGSVTLTADQLDGLTITPPANSNVDFALTITATSTEAATGDTATTTVSMDVAVAGVADAANVELQVGDGVVVNEDELDDYGFNCGNGNAVAGSIYALSVVAAATDTDGSESMAITLGGLPEGVELSAGSDNGDGTWSLQSDQLSSLNLYVPSDVSTDFQISVTAVTTEADTGDSATMTESATVDVVDIPQDAEDQVIYGSNADDDLEGGAGDDYIRGFGGDDEIEGGAGADAITGDWGNDTIDGGAGADWIHGGSGDDTAFGGEGDDIIHGSWGNDTLIGGEGDDTLVGGDGDDVLIGGAGDDVLTGGDGRDTFVFDAESGHDIITDIFEQDTMVFEGQEFHMDDLILSENNEGNVVVSFQGVEDTSVTLDGVTMEDIQSDGGDSGYSVTEDAGKVTITIDTE